MIKLIKQITLIFLVSALAMGTTTLAEEYPQLDIDGKKEYNLTMGDMSGNLELSKKESLFSRFPATHRSQPFKWEERLSLFIAGKLSEDLSVSYALEQEPDFPDRFDIKVKYRTHEINFGHFNTTFASGDFISFSKAMDGFMATTKEDDYSAKVVTAKERSSASKITVQGNGQKDYNLGQRYILPGSVKVRINGDNISSDQYSVNNYDGKIAFNKIYNSTDVIEIMYEFTNPLQDLIPTLGKVNFLGFEADYAQETEPDPVPIIITANEIVAIPAPPPVIPREELLDYQYILRPDFKFAFSQASPGGTITINATTPFAIRRVYIQFEYNDAGNIPLRLTRRPTREDIQNNNPLKLEGYYTLPETLAPGTHNAVINFETNKGTTKQLSVSYFVNQPLAIIEAGQKTLESIPSGNDFAQDFASETIGTKQSFTLKNAPIIIGSERIVINGVVLQKDFDYYLNYLEGTLKIVSYELTPSDKIEISYLHQQTHSVTENILGNGTVGPYFFKRTPIVRKSEAIVLNERKLFRGLDYEFDYETGKLNFFTKIYPSDKLKATYNSIDMIVPPKTNQQPEKYRVGVTYLQESSQSQKEETSQEISVTRSSVTVQGNSISLASNQIPISADNPLVVVVNGNTLTLASATSSGDMSVNYYKGIITITSANITIDDATSINISYKLLKGFDAQWRFSIGSTAKTTIRSDSEYPIQFTPAVYNSATVKIRNLGSALNFEVLPTANYEIQYLESGSELEIKFISTNINSNYIGDWQITNKEILVNYLYSPGNFAEAGDIVHKVIGIRGRQHINKNLYIQGEFAQSSQETNRGIVSAEDLLTGTGGTDAKYELTTHRDDKDKAGIVKDSEQVIIENTNKEQVQIGSDQYSLNYQAGYLRFRRGLVPQTTDKIRIRYRYYVSRQDQAEKVIETGSAIKVQTGGKVEDWTMSGYFSDVDAKFNPVGNITQAKGTSEIGGTAVYQPNKHFKFATDIRENTARKADSELKPYNAKTLAQKYNLFFKPLNYGVMSLTHEQTTQGDDAHNTAANQGVHEIDITNTKQALNYAFDFYNYPSLLEINKANETNPIANTGKDTNFLHLRNTYTPYSQFTLISDFQESIDAQHSSAGAGLGQLTSQKITSITKTNISWQPFSQIRTLTNYNYQRILAKNDVTVTSNTASLQEIRDWNFDYNYTPGFGDSAFTNLNLHGNYSHIENQQAFSGYAPDTDDKQSFDTRLNPWNLFGFSYNNNISNYWYSNNKDTRTNRNHALAFSNFSFFSLLNLSSLSISNRLNERTNLTETTSSRNFTSSKEDALSYAVSAMPLFYINTNYNYQEKHNIDDTIILYANDITNTKNIDHPYLQHNWSFKFAPPPLSIPFINLGLGNFDANSTMILIRDNTNEQNISNNVSATPNLRSVNTDSENWGANYSYQFMPNLGFSDNYTRAQVKLYDTTSVSTANRNKEEYSQGNKASATWSNPLWFLPLNQVLNLTRVGANYNTSDIFRMEFEQNLALIIDTKEAILEADFQPLNYITIQGHYSKLRELKFDTTANFTTNTQTLREYFDNRFLRNTDVIRGTVIYSPFSFLSLKSSAENSDIKWNNFNRLAGSTTSKYITAFKLSGGASFTPFSDLTISLDHAWIHLNDIDQVTQADGWQNNIKATYRPVSWTWEKARGKVFFTYNSVINHGIGLNSLEQKYQSKDNFTLTATEITRVENVKETLELNADIEIPMDSPVINKITVTATGTIVRQADSIDSKNDFNMSLFNINGKIWF